MVDGNRNTFQDWLCMTPFGGKQVILGVEVAPKNIVRVLFKHGDRYDAEHILQNLYSMTEEKFGKSIAQSMLDENALKKVRSNYKDEISHSQTLLQFLLSPRADQIRHNLLKLRIENLLFIMALTSTSLKEKTRKHQKLLQTTILSQFGSYGRLL